MDTFVHPSTAAAILDDEERCSPSRMTACDSNSINQYYHIYIIHVWYFVLYNTSLLIGKGSRMGLWGALRNTYHMNKRKDFNRRHVHGVNKALAAAGKVPCVCRPWYSDIGPRHSTYKHTCVHDVHMYPYLYNTWIQRHGNSSTTDVTRDVCVWYTF